MLRELPIFVHHPCVDSKLMYNHGFLTWVSIASRGGKGRGTGGHITTHPLHILAKSAIFGQIQLHFDHLVGHITPSFFTGNRLSWFPPLLNMTHFFTSVKEIVIQLSKTDCDTTWSWLSLWVSNTEHGYIAFIYAILLGYHHKVLPKLNGTLLWYLWVMIKHDRVLTF